LTRDEHRGTIFVVMRSLVASLVGASLVLLAAVTGARAQPSSFNGGANLSIKGWGAVTPRKGWDLHRSIACQNASCSGEALFARIPQVILTATPYQGWKFLRWRGPCEARKTLPTCAINLRHLHPDPFGQRVARIQGIFAPVAPGLTRSNPIPVGTAASIGRFITMRVNSANPNVQLSPAPLPGYEYFDANLTVTYTGGGSATAGGLTYDVRGSHNTSYTRFANACPDPGPQPPLDYKDPIPSGQSTSGYVCWTIASNDQSSLELYIGSGTLNYPGTTWLALH
jgi:Divergent InlB B-repeat domain